MQVLYKNNLCVGEELQEKLLKGIEQVSEVIRASYGPKGKNYVIQTDRLPGHQVGNDADTFIQSVYCYDPVENRGLNFIKELSSTATKSSGEGRKTTIIIAEQLLKGGFESKVKGMKLKEEIESIVPSVLESLDKQSEKVELEDIAKVAITSSRSKELGKKIAEVYQEVGRDGIITVEGSGTFDTFHETTTGVVFKDAKWNNPYLETKDGKATYEKPSILVSRTAISNEAQIESFMASFINSKKRDLVIFCDNIAPRVVALMTSLHRTGKMSVLLINPPVLWKDEVYEDFAKCVGASILEEESGVNWKNLVKEIEQGRFKLGTCEKLITDGEETLLLGIQDITDHKTMLQEKVDAKGHDANDAKRRLWRLNAKTAVLKIGAGSESDLSYKLLKAKDALNACRAALIEGICTGGGKVLFDIGENLMGGRKKESAEHILGKALCAPHIQLLENEGKPMIDGVYQPLKLKDVYDATLVLKNAVRNSVSLAGIVMTLGADVRARDITDQELQVRLASMKNQQMFG